MKNRIKKDSEKSSRNEFFLKVIKFDDKFAGLVKKAREDCQLPFSIEDDEFLKQQEKKLFYWIGFIRETYNLPTHWSPSLWKYITEKELPDPGIGISYNSFRSFTHFENRFEPLKIEIYEQVSIENIKDWLEENKKEVNYHLGTLPHRRRSMINEGLVLEILRMRFKDKMRPKDIYGYYNKLRQEKKISTVLYEMLSYNYITTVISRYKKLLKGEPFYKKHHKNR